MRPPEKICGKVMDSADWPGLHHAICTGPPEGCDHKWPTLLVTDEHLSEIRAADMDREVAMRRVPGWGR